MKFTSETAAEAGRIGGSRPKAKKPPEEKYKIVSFRLPSTTIALIRERAEKHGITQGELILRAVKRFY